MMRLSVRLLMMLALSSITACGDSDEDSTSMSEMSGDTSGGTTGGTTALGEVFEVTSVSPSMGSPLGGEMAVVSGEGFEEGLTVVFGNEAAVEVVLLSEFQVKVITPPGTGTVSVSVTTPDGEVSTLDSAYTYVTSDLPEEEAVSWCTIQYPNALTVAPNTESESVYGRVFVAGCSDGDKACDAVVGELGYGAEGGDPSLDASGYTWVSARYNPTHTSDDNDEFEAKMTVDREGSYRYVYRFSVDSGGTWTYCDLDGGENGFSASQQGVMTVGEPTYEVSWCTIQYPAALTVAPNIESEPVYGRVFVPGCSDGEQACGDVVGELGYGAAEGDPSIDAGSYTWVSAGYNPTHTADDNDEFGATLTVDGEGSYRYAYRFSVDSGASWTYCDLDGGDNGFSASQQGVMSVGEPTNEVSWCTIQYPDALTVAQNTESEPVYGRVYVAGCSDGEQACDAVVGELGYGVEGSDPTLDAAGYTWVSASYNPSHTSDDNDEFEATVIVDSEGSYDYVYRFSVDSGVSWTYCDLDGGENGFSESQQGVMTVGEPTYEVSWCNIQYPNMITASRDVESEPVYGRAYVAGCTDGNAVCGAISAELGFGPFGADPSLSPEMFSWSSASYNPEHTSDDNDEFEATLLLSAGDMGSFAYVYRFSVDSGSSWRYCDLSGDDFSPAELGTLQIADE